MTEPTLTEFLLARIAEDEAAAHQATPARWKLWGMEVLADTAGDGAVDRATSVAHTYHRDEHGKPRTWDARHIIAWQPERVLAECEAKRQILRQVLGDAVDKERDWQYLDRIHARHSGGGYWPQLTALAAVYAYHPDYREEWRP